MATNVNQPARPSQRVYRRRQLAALLGLLAVLTMIVLIIVQVAAGDDAPKAAPKASPSAVASPASTAVPGCAADAVAVTSIVDADAYEAGQLPQLSMSVANTTQQPCTLNVGTTQMVFLITSGDEQYWVSTDCQQGAVDAPAVLEPGKPLVTAPITWDRTRSAPETCDVPDRDPVPAGGATYRLTVSLGALSGEPVPFMLF